MSGGDTEVAKRAQRTIDLWSNVNKARKNGSNRIPARSRAALLTALDLLVSRLAHSDANISILLRFKNCCERNELDAAQRVWPGAHALLDLAIRGGARLIEMAQQAEEHWQQVDAYIPFGWEGPAPDRVLKEVTDVAAWVWDELSVLRHMAELSGRGEFFVERANQVMRNSQRALDNLRFASKLRWPAPIKDPMAAETFLANLSADLNVLVSSAPSSQESLEANQPKPRGRRKSDYETIQGEAKMAADWAKARDSAAKVQKCDFVKQLGISVKKFDALLNRVSKRKARLDK